MLFRQQPGQRRTFGRFAGIRRPCVAATSQSPWTINLNLPSRYQLPWSHEDRNNHKFVLAAVRHDENALQYAEESLRANKAFMRAAVRHKESALQYADKSLRVDKEFILELFKQGYRSPGPLLDHQVEADAAESLALERKCRRDIVLATMMSGHGILKYIDASLKNDHEILLAASKYAKNERDARFRELRRGLRHCTESFVCLYPIFIGSFLPSPELSALGAVDRDTSMETFGRMAEWLLEPHTIGLNFGLWIFLWTFSWMAGWIGLPRT